MKVWTTAAVVALSVTVITGYAFAQSANGQGRGMRCAQRFAELDTNNDKQVTLAEFKAVSHPRGDAETIFTSRDANKDGVLTKVEFCPGS